MGFFFGGGGFIGLVALIVFMITILEGTVNFIWYHCIVASFTKQASCPVLLMDSTFKKVRSAFQQSNQSAWPDKQKQLYDWSV